MIKRFKFSKRTVDDEDWFTHYALNGLDINICPDDLEEYVDIHKAKTIYLCFSDKLHPKKYAYQYHFAQHSNFHPLFLRLQSTNRAPFLRRTDQLFWDAAERGLIPKKGWGWVEYE